MLACLGPEQAQGCVVRGNDATVLQHHDRLRCGLDFTTVRSSSRAGCCQRRPPPSHRGHSGGQFARRERLDHVVVGTAHQTQNAIRFGGRTGQHDDVHRWCDAAKFADQLDARHAGQLPVQHGNVDVELAYDPKRDRAVFGLHHLVAMVLEATASNPPYLHVIVDDKNPHAIPPSWLPASRRPTRRRPVSARASYQDTHISPGRDAFATHLPGGPCPRAGPSTGFPSCLGQRSSM